MASSPFFGYIYHSEMGLTMELTVGQKQELFMELLPKLLEFAFANGYKVRGGELQRTKAQAEQNAASGAGISNSLHLICLAIDLKLFKNGVYLTRSEDYGTLGAFWKTLHPLCRWGGDFQSRPDGNHFSVEHGGVR